MPMNPRVVELTRNNVNRAFAQTPGVAAAKIYPTAITENVYGDDEDVEFAPGRDIYAFIQFDAPIKVVKSLGWWREGETLPILMYLSFVEGLDPKKGDRVVLPSEEGYMSGVWILNSVKTYGQGEPICWLCSVSQDRSNAFSIPN